MKAKEMIEAKITELTAKLKEGFPIGAPYMEDEVTFFKSLLAAIDADMARLDAMESWEGVEKAACIALSSKMTVREAIDKYGEAINAHRREPGDVVD